MRAIVLVLAACSAGVEPPAPSSPQIASEPEPVGELVLPAPAPLPPIVTGIPEGSIEKLAVTEDGTAAVTSSGSLRLWPALDGTREPVVIAARGETAQLAIERAAGFTIARLDDTGTLEVIRATETGAVASRTRIASERALVEVRLVAGIVLGLTDDGAVVRIANGRITGRLAPPSGERIAALLVRRGRALAVLASATGARGRWIGEPFAWAGETAALAAISDEVAISADHRLLATADRKARAVVILDLATGKQIAIARTVTPDAFDRVQIAGFHEDGALATVVDGKIEVWRAGKHTPIVPRHGFFARPVATDREIISTYDHQLALIGETTRYLGYQVSGPTLLRPGPAGLLVGTSRALYRLDDGLAIRARHELGEAYHVAPVDDERALVSRKQGVALVEIATGKELQRLSETGFFDYHPVTRLVALQDLGKIQLGFYQPRKKRVGPLVPAEVTEGVDLFVKLLDPAISRGRIAAIVEQSFDPFEPTITIHEIRAVRPAAEEPIVYGETRILEPDHRDLGFPISVRRKRADGHEIEIGNSRITLRDPSGETRWVLPAGDLRDAAWTASDELVVLGGGVGVLDLATGGFVRRRCGWDFRLAVAPVTEGHGLATLCSRE